MRTAPCPLTPKSSGDWCVRLNDGSTLHIKLVGGVFVDHIALVNDVQFQLKEVADEEKGDGSKKLAFDWPNGVEVVLSSFDGETITWIGNGPAGTAWSKPFYWDRMDEDDVRIREAKAAGECGQGDLFQLNVCHVHPNATCDGSRVFPIAGTRYICFDRKAMLPPGTKDDHEGDSYDLCQSEYDRLPEEKKRLMHAIQPGMVSGEALEGSAAYAWMRKEFPDHVWTVMERMYLGHHVNPWCEALSPGRSPGAPKAKRSRSSLRSASSDDMFAGFEERFEQAMEINMQNFEEQVEAEMRRRLGR